MKRQLKAERIAGGIGKVDLEDAGEAVRGEDGHQTVRWGRCRIGPAQLRLPRQTNRSRQGSTRKKAPKRLHVAQCTASMQCSASLCGQMKAACGPQSVGRWCKTGRYFPPLGQRFGRVAAAPKIARSKAGPAVGKEAVDLTPGPNALRNGLAQPAQGQLAQSTRSKTAVPPPGMGTERHGHVVPHGAKGPAALDVREPTVAIECSRVVFRACTCHGSRSSTRLRMGQHRARPKCAIGPAHAAMGMVTALAYPAGAGMGGVSVAPGSGRRQRKSATEVLRSAPASAYADLGCGSIGHQ